ncbi:hypothetical protein HanXRQr2_Chr02g0081951 [Helianthus annuus]|uniref:Uncharacterized protein n=1 Tax=Helianthus annuus TaxID=4232 RepID=A0A251VEU7_HELAN|nr:hypothetical protein HanXRQr2_Chr02g0081951 [Helianthus annuus]KAJ0605935.1 hypothetical protein HanHA300_Chr02g0068531 [Helianthus annuus]KAJ0616841.1 hypothetical protein HanIR_Chr02g0094981 [Helianthus annuus]KAJ0619930.1 hypothetical protein HanHA89_Chr02g0076781 [Helianthus annuus]KAJ0953032.1 hypothetical protein HanPSC8_Chr02g0079301 [Helianthus annuus]
MHEVRLVITQVFYTSSKNLHWQGLKHGWLTSQRKAGRRARTWTHTVSVSGSLLSMYVGVLIFMNVKSLRKEYETNESI